MRLSADRGLNWILSRWWVMRQRRDLHKTYCRSRSQAQPRSNCRFQSDAGLVLCKDSYELSVLNATPKACGRIEFSITGRTFIFNNGCLSFENSAINLTRRLHFIISTSSGGKVITSWVACILDSNLVTCWAYRKSRGLMSFPSRARHGQGSPKRTSAAPIHYVPLNYLRLFPSRFSPALPLHLLDLEHRQ